MVILDVAIVNVALPSIQADLGFTQTSLQWVVSAYAIMFGGVLLLGGRLGRPPGAPAPVPHRPRRLLGGSLLCGLAWSESLPDRVPRPAGSRRRAPRSRGALAPDDDVRGRPRAQQGARRLRGGLRQRRRGRRPRRWAPDVVPELAVDLLHQRARRAGRDRARPRAPAGEPRRARPPALRPRRGHDDHRGPDAPRLRADACDDRGWASASTLGLLAALGSARRSRSWSSSTRSAAPCSRSASSGCPRLPPPTSRWRSSGR